MRAVTCFRSAFESCLGGERQKGPCRFILLLIRRGNFITKRDKYLEIDQMKKVMKSGYNSIESESLQGKEIEHS